MPCLQHDRVKIGSSSLDVDAWKIKAPPFDFTSFILTRWWEQKVSVVIIVWESFLTRFQVCSDFQNTILEFHEKKNIIEAHFRMTDESSVPSIVSSARLPFEFKRPRVFQWTRESSIKSSILLQSTQGLVLNTRKAV